MSTGLRDRMPMFQSTVRISRGRATPATALPNARYECDAELGKGGMGRVQRGLDRFLGRTVALKWSLTNEPEMLALLMREAEIASRLNHPSIITIYDVAHGERDEPFVVMRLVEGQRLSDLIAATASFDARLQLLPRIVPAIDAVAFAHRNSVVHRDLKPDNILLGELGDTVVIDWGLALDPAMGDDPFAGQVAGTPEFMSPEQEKGEPIDARADVFALGATLYSLLAGKPPARDDDIARALVTAVPGVPRDLVAIVAKATAPLGDRYPTAEQLAADLHRFIGGQLVAAHHYTFAQRVRRWVQQRRAAVAIAAIAIVVSAVIGVVALRGVIGARAVAEHERTSAVGMADRLLVDRARSVVAVDPVRALALLDLRRSPRDSEVEMAALEAHTRGLPTVWRAHDGPITSVLALGERRVVTAGRDGKVVLRNRDGSVKTIATLEAGIGPSLDPVAGGFAVSGQREVVVFSPAGEITQRFAAGASSGVEIGGRWIVWADGNRVRGRTIDDATIHQLADGDYHDLTLDPQGRWLAIAETESIRVIDLATRAETAKLPWQARMVMASPDGTKLLASRGDTYAEWSTTDFTQPPKPIVAPYGTAAYVGPYPVIASARCIYTTGVGWRDPLLCLDAPVRSLRSHGDFMVAYDGTAVAVLSIRGSNVNAERFGGVPARGARADISADGADVVAVSDSGHVVLWNHAERAARFMPLNAQSITMVDDRVIAAADGDVVEIGETSTRPLAKSGPNLGGFGNFVVVGDRVYMWSELDRRVLALTNDDPIPIANDVLVIDVLDDRLVLGMAHRVTAYDTAAGTSTVLVEHAAELRSLHAHEGQIAVAWVDGHVWWHDGTRARTANAGCDPIYVRVHVAGVDASCAGRLVEVFAPNGPRTIAVLPKLARYWNLTAGRGGIVTEDKALYRLEAGALTQLVPPGRHPSPALASGRFVSVDAATNDIYLHDLASNARAWLGSLPGTIHVGISKDGRKVIAHSARGLLWWSDPSPADPAAWPAWKAKITPARLADPMAALEWR